MDNQSASERSAPVQYVRNSRAFRQFKNPPQPHMCIQDTIKETSQKLYINVLGWQKIANPKQYSDPIPLYGGMPVPQGCGPNSNKPPLSVFAVMVNPDILKANGKNSTNSNDRDALVSLLCDFVEAMNPGLTLARNPVILKDRDLAGELKDVWLAVQNQREREKGLTQDVMYKVYDIDGIGSEDPINDEDKSNSPRNEDGFNTSPTRQNSDKKALKSSKQILMNAGQKSEFDSGMNNCQLNKTQDKFGNSMDDTTYCTSVYGQIVSSRENHNQINELQQKFSMTESKPSGSFRKESNPLQDKKVEGFDEFSKRNISKLKTSDNKVKKQKCLKNDKSNNLTNGKNHYDFFPVFDNKADVTESKPSKDTNGEMVTNNVKEEIRNDNSKMIIDPMQKLMLHTTDNGLCDNTSLSSISS